MGDREFRSRERAVRAGGVDEGVRARLLREGLRTGRVDREGLEIAAFFGHRAAQEVIDSEREFVVHSTPPIRPLTHMAWIYSCQVLEFLSGRDVELTARVVDAFSRAALSREIGMWRVRCPTCNGTGRSHRGRRIGCPRCGKKGTINNPFLKVEKCLNAFCRAAFGDQRNDDDAVEEWRRLHRAIPRSAAHFMVDPLVISLLSSGRDHYRATRAVEAVIRSCVLEAGVEAVQREVHRRVIPWVLNEE